MSNIADTTASQVSECLDLEVLKRSFAERNATVGVIGLGYVGLPLVKAFNASGFRVIGFDVDRDKVAQLQSGETYIRTVPSEAIRAMVDSGRFRATVDFADIETLDAILICVPTPLNKYREPDLSFVARTAEAIVPHLRPGQLAILESTTYPGTTTELLRPILERLLPRLFARARGSGKSKI